VRTSSQEALWVLRAQGGDSEALELLLGQLLPSLRRYLAAVVGPADADDVTQDVLVLIYRKLRWLHDPDPFRPWAFRIASRAGFRHVRKQRRPMEALVEDVAPTTEPVDADGVKHLLTRAALSPGVHAVLMLHFQEDMSLEEVAAVLELPLGTVKSRLADGLARLRRNLGARRKTDVR
jgi:RNA polymerase sigma-70 factor (ECF subfamily)